MRKKFILALVLICPVELRLYADEEPRRIGAFKGVHVADIAFSDDSKLVAAIGYDENDERKKDVLVVWDLSSEREVFRHSEPAAYFRQVAFSPDGKTIAAGGRRGPTKVWELPCGREIAQLNNNSDKKDFGINCVRFSPDGKLLALSGYVRDKDADAIVLWDTGNYSKKRLLLGVERAAMTIAFSADGKVIAAGDLDGKVHFWNAADGKHFKVVAVGKRPLTQICFAPKGSLLAAAVASGRGAAGEIRLVSDFTKVERLELKLAPSAASVVCSMAFSPDGKKLFVGCAEALEPLFQIRPLFQVWDVAEKKLADGLFQGQVGFYATSMAVSRDGRFLAVAEADMVVDGLVVNDVAFPSMRPLALWGLPKDFHMAAPK